MQEAGGTAHTEWPRALIYTTALACGLFLALAVHIGLSVAGVGFAGLAPDVIFSGKNQINTALAWWTIGIAGCLGSLGTIAVARRLNHPRLHNLRLVLALAFFCLLTFAGYKATAPAAASAAVTTALNLAAMTLGGFMAFFAAHFAARR